MNERNVYMAALEKYGVHNQINQLCEECAELIVAVNHARRGRVGREEVISELVDVSIMLEQMKLVYGPDEWARAYTEKIGRLEIRIAEDVK